MGSPQLARVSSKMRSGTAGWTMSRTSRYVQVSFPYACTARPWVVTHALSVRQRQLSTVRLHECGQVGAAPVRTYD